MGLYFIGVLAMMEISIHFHISTDIKGVQKTLKNGKTIGMRIEEQRKNLHLSQAQLAQQSFVSRSCIANYERNNRIPSDDTLKILSKVLGVSMEYLRTGAGNEERESPEQIPLVE